MVVIAGSAQGTRLRPPGKFVKGVGRDARAGMFDALGDVAGRRDLDLYARAGGLGIEALSRGAASATFVETSPQAISRLEANLETTGLLDRAEVVCDRVENILAAPSNIRFGLIFVDPQPNASLRAVVRDLESLVIGGYLADAGTIVVCRKCRESQLKPLGLRKTWERACGDRSISAFTHGEEA